MRNDDRTSWLQLCLILIVRVPTGLNSSFIVMFTINRAVITIRASGDVVVSGVTTSRVVVF